jgi:hypothetical protein
MEESMSKPIQQQPQGVPVEVLAQFMTDMRKLGATKVSMMGIEVSFADPVRVEPSAPRSKEEEDIEAKKRFEALHYGSA